MRDKNRIEPFLNQLHILWEQNSDLRFGQLVYILNIELCGDSDSFDIEDDKYLEQIIKDIERCK
jgi:hypothetical protein